MKELLWAFYDVMYKYKKSFSEKGVMANLNAWKEAKTPLIELLRRHPNWREKDLALVFEYSEGREIDTDVVDEVCYTLTDLACDVIPPNRWLDFGAALNAAVSEYSRTPSEEKLKVIREKGGIKCSVGQKTSRIIGRLCRQFGVDSHKRYNSVYAQLADALNPMQMQKTAVLSVHPCDFLEMSNKDSTWISCHNLRDGGYQAGCLSYMTDSVSMVFFTVDEDVKDHFYQAPRRSRQMFFYKDGMLFQSRLYPNDSNELMEQYRALVQKAIADCLGAPNLWTIKVNREDLRGRYETAAGSKQYPDYDYTGNLSFLKGFSSDSILQIGHSALCVCCGRSCSRGSLKCNCEDVVVCQDCGKTVPGKQARYVDGAYHCAACLHICAVCQKSTHETMYPAFDRRGNLMEVCLDCYQATLAPCASCSVHNACQIIGRALCPRTAVAAV